MERVVLAKSKELRAKSKERENSMLLALCSMLRYRFFLFAGLFPYVLGQAAAFNARRVINWQRFYLGFLGIIFCVIGVELFNEYFDAREGGDRIFSQKLPEIPQYFYMLGILAFGAALVIGLYLAFQAGCLIMVFSLLGFLAAYFYVGPPLKLAYRGLGEAVIAFSYGPLMLLGSYYLQAQRIDMSPILASLICALAMFCLAIVNEMPDYYQDKLVGKRNLVVKLGKLKAMRLLAIGLICMFFLLGLGIVSKKLPLSVTIVFLAAPWVLKSLNVARKDCDNPKVYLSAINTLVIVYLAVSFSLIFGYISYRAAGSSNENELPSPSLLSTHSLPLCSSKILLLIDSPTPSPPYFRFSEEST